MKPDAATLNVRQTTDPIPVGSPIKGFSGRSS